MKLAPCWLARRGPPRWVAAQSPDPPRQRAQGREDQPLAPRCFRASGPPALAGWRRWASPLPRSEPRCRGCAAQRLPATAGVALEARTGPEVPRGQDRGLDGVAAGGGRRSRGWRRWNRGLPEGWGRRHRGDPWDRGPPNRGVDRDRGPPNRGVDRDRGPPNRIAPEGRGQRNRALPEGQDSPSRVLQEEGWHPEGLRLLAGPRFPVGPARPTPDRRGETREGAAVLGVPEGLRLGAQPPGRSPPPRGERCLLPARPVAPGGAAGCAQQAAGSRAGPAGQTPPV